MNDAAFLERLVADRLLAEASARRAGSASAETGTSIERTLMEFGLVAEEDLYRALAGFLGLEFRQASGIDPSLVQQLGLPLEFLLRIEMIPAAQTEDGVIVATSNPRARDAVEAVAFHLRLPVIPAIAAPSAIKSALQSLSGTGQQDDDVASRDVERLAALANDGPVIKLVNDLIAEAADTRASDIHLEAGETELRVRFRVDGALRTVRRVSEAQRAAVVSRLKVMAGLNISEKRRPQDGRAQLSVRGRSVDIRLSTLPTQYGESIVLRLLDRANVSLDWHALGYDPVRIAEIERVANMPNGIFLVAGPTGSGKTTTLYTALSGINSEDRKIVTVEDPIEFSLDGVNQVQVEPGIDMTFARALRAILRQDPDVIMVGEIRDEETAEIAVRAALVGRLVLSTIHTNDALSAVTRLIDLGVPRYLLAATLRGVLSQRLVRTICADCGGAGCKACRETGSKGRTVVSEFLSLTEGVSEGISNGAGQGELAALARGDGFRSMSQMAEELRRTNRVDPAELQRALGGAI